MIDAQHLSVRGGGSHSDEKIVNQCSGSNSVKVLKPVLRVQFLESTHDQPVFKVQFLESTQSVFRVNSWKVLNQCSGSNNF